MISSTLTTLAMLKVQIDHGRDYLDYLKPFILQVLIDHRQDSVTDVGVQECIRSDFGLEIPARTIQIVLKRLSRNQILKKQDGVYQISGEVPNPMIGAQKANAERHINAISTGLKNFSIAIGKPALSDAEADEALRAFISKFALQCLRACLRGTAIPEIDGHQNAHIVLVSKYVLNLQKTNPERFDSFLIVVKGNMLANALLCPDLQNAPKTYDKVIFYLDTPLLIRLLGLEGASRKNSINDLIKLLIFLGGTTAAFNHTRNELERVIKSAANHIDSVNGRSAIVSEARAQGVTKSDLLLLASLLDEKLHDGKIKVIPTPHYMPEFQIDELEFSDILDKELSYSNPQAKNYDINSVRSIYALRARLSPQNIEKCKAVLITSNTAFAKAAFKYGDKFQESQNVSTVITDFSLANMAWLKAPVGAPSIPMREVLAFSYAALQPSPAMWDKYLLEAEKLEKEKAITARELQLLRSSELAQEELMTLTLGEEDSLSEETLTEILNRVTKEIKREESDKLLTERSAHIETLKQLEVASNEKFHIRQCIYWRSERKARYLAWSFSIGIISLIAIGIAISIGIDFQNSLFKFIIPTALGVLFVFTFTSLLWGSTIKGLHDFIHIRCRQWFISRESLALGIDMIDPYS